MKSVSVVMGTYNGARFLQEQLASLEHQTLKPYEIIISDDGSTDGTLQILNAFADKTRLPVLVTRTTRNLGFADNFLQAALQARGDLVAFCDQDDIWRSDKLEVCARQFDDAEVMLCAHKATLIDEAQNAIGIFHQGIAADTDIAPLGNDPWGVYFGFSMVFRRALLEIISPKERGIDYITGRRKLAHDRWILFLANMVGKTRLIAAELVGYRQHTSNTFGAGGGGRWRAVTRSIDDICKEAECYVQASREFRALIPRFARDTAERFPLFDERACIAFWDKVSVSQEDRLASYTDASRLMRVTRVIHALAQGRYINPASNQFRPMALGKDLLITIRPR